MKADVVDGIGGTIEEEFLSVVGMATKAANEPGEILEIDYHSGDACFRTFADSKTDIGPRVVGKVKKGTHHGAEGVAS